MKKNCIIVLLVLVATAAFAERPMPSSENTPKLAKLLKEHPQLDLDRNGVLSLKEAKGARDSKSRQPRTNHIAPTYNDIQYDNLPATRLDFWKTESDKATALFVWFHPGGFRAGDKVPMKTQLLEPLLKAGVSVASVNYRLTGVGPYPMQMKDSVRAIQFLRFKAAEWNIDRERLAVGGGSAGSGISQWLAFHDDLANPTSNDPVERLSSRVSCALALNMQSTYDPRVIKEIIPGAAFNDGALKPFYGLPNDWDWETANINAQLDALIKDASPINHLTADDPPVFIFHSERTRTDGNIHHPNFGVFLESAMKKLDIESIRKTDADYNSRDAANEAMIRFILYHLGGPAKERKNNSG